MWHKNFCKTELPHLCLHLQWKVKGEGGRVRKNYVVQHRHQFHYHCHFHCCWNHCRMEQVHFPRLDEAVFCSIAVIQTTFRCSSAFFYSHRSLSPFLFAMLTDWNSQKFSTKSNKGKTLRYMKPKKYVVRMKIQALCSEWNKNCIVKPCSESLHAFSCRCCPYLTIVRYRHLDNAGLSD